jgi:hypothetical protein
MSKRLLVRAVLVSCAVTCVPVICTAIILATPYHSYRGTTTFWDWLVVPFLLPATPGLIISALMYPVLPPTRYTNHGVDLYVIVLGNLVFYTCVVYLILRRRKRRNIGAAKS